MSNPLQVSKTERLPKSFFRRLSIQITLGLMLLVMLIWAGLISLGQNHNPNPVRPPGPPPETDGIVFIGGLPSIKMEYSGDTYLSYFVDLTRFIDFDDLQPEPWPSTRVAVAGIEYADSGVEVCRSQDNCDDTRTFNPGRCTANDGREINREDRGFWIRKNPARENPDNGRFMVGFTPYFVCPDSNRKDFRFQEIGFIDTPVVQYPMVSSDRFEITWSYPRRYGTYQGLVPSWMDRMRYSTRNTPDFTLHWSESLDNLAANQITFGFAHMLRWENNRYVFSGELTDIKATGFQPGSDIFFQLQYIESRSGTDYTIRSPVFRHSVPQAFQNVALSGADQIRLRWEDDYFVLGPNEFQPGQSIDRYEYRLGNPVSGSSTNINWTTEEWTEVCNMDIGEETVGGTELKTLTITGPGAAPEGCGADTFGGIPAGNWRVQLRGVDTDLEGSAHEQVVRHWVSSTPITTTS